MLLSAVSVLVDAQSSSEIPEGIMNNSVYYICVCVCVLKLQMDATLRFQGNNF